MRKQLSDTALFGQNKVRELAELNFMGQLQCTMRGKRKGPIKGYPMFWNLNPLERKTSHVLKIAAGTETCELVSEERAGRHKRLRCAARHTSGIPDHQKDDLGDDESSVGDVYVS